MESSLQGNFDLKTIKTTKQQYYIVIPKNCGRKSTEKSILRFPESAQLDHLSS